MDMYMLGYNGYEISGLLKLDVVDYNFIDSFGYCFN